MNKSVSIFTLTAVVILASLLITPGCKTASADLNGNPLQLDVVWVLDSIHYSDQNVVIVVRTFSLTFRESGTVDMVVDCNSCFGTYSSTDSGSLNFISTNACTEVACGNESRDDEFHRNIGLVSRYEDNGSSLRIYFTFDGVESYMSFSK